MKISEIYATEIPILECKTNICSDSSDSAKVPVCLGDRGCVVGAKRGGAPCKVKIHRIKPDLRKVNGSGKMIV